MILKIFFALISLGFCASLIKAEQYMECFNKEPGTFVALASNCSKAIYCNGPNSREVECDNRKPYFSEEIHSCDEDANKCGDRPFGNKVTPIVPIITITTTTTTQTPETSTSTTTSTSTSTTLRPPSSSSSLWCPPEDDTLKPLFFPHPKSCSQYYLCYHGVATVMQCPSGLHFDASLQSCNTANNVNCQIPNQIHPRDQCLPQTVDVYPHDTNCNYYYKCEYGYLMIMQCPFNMGWDYEQRICIKKSKAKCYRDLELN
ncbi:uncharacterized protein ACRADG_001813 [Cochliomyia hominivorax]